MSIVDKKYKSGLMGLLFILLMYAIVSMVFALFWSSIPEERQTEVVHGRIDNLGILHNDTLLTLYNQPREYMVEVRAVNDNDINNVSLRINTSHIAEIKESNGSLIIEIRKDVIK